MLGQASSGYVELGQMRSGEDRSVRVNSD